MKQLASRVTARILVSSFLLMMTAAPAFCQAAEKAQEAGPAEESSDGWKAFTLLVFFAIAIAIGCFMAPKRTHLD